MKPDANPNPSGGNPKGDLQHLVREVERERSPSKGAIPQLDKPRDPYPDERSAEEILEDLERCLSQPAHV
jgi:hypothetical protein